MATHSSILAWETPWTEEPGGLRSKGSQSQTWLSNSTHTWRYDMKHEEPTCLALCRAVLASLSEVREGGRWAGTAFGDCWFTLCTPLPSATIWSTFWLLVKEGCSSERGRLNILCWDLGAQTPGGGVNPPLHGAGLWGEGGFASRASFYLSFQCAHMLGAYQDPRASKKLCWIKYF